MEEDYDINEEVNTISEKFSRDEWNLIEGMDTNSFDRMVIECLTKLGLGEKKSIEEELVVLGERFYRMIRSKITKYLVDEEEDLYIDKKEKLTKKDEIRFNNTISRINKQVDDLLKTFSDEEQTDRYGFMSNCVEIRGITLMYCGYYATKKGIKTEIYEVYVGIQKFIIRMKNYKGNSYNNKMEKISVSNTMIEDLMKWIERIKNLEKISGIYIYKNVPHLIIYSKYDNNFIKPYDSQIELIELMKKNIENGFLIMYNAMIGLGKTTMASVTIPIYVSKLREDEKYKKLQIIVCCNIPSVRLQVAHYAYIAGIKFGIGSIDNNGGIKIINHFTCKKDEDRVLIICSPEVAIEILKLDYERVKFDGKGSNYILFLDEPNVGADIINSKMLKDNMELFRYLPDKTILSSATMSDVREIKDFIEFYRKRWEKTCIEKIYSNEIPIGCDIITIDGNYLIPHYGCNTKDELKRRIEIIKQNPFLGRLYTVDTAFTLWRDMALSHIESIPNIDELFKDVNNLSSIKVKSLSMDMLDELVNSEKVCDICRYEKKTEPINLRRIGTSDAFRLVGMTLIASDNPKEFCKENFKDLMEDLEKVLSGRGYRSIMYLLRKMDDKEEERKRKIKKICEKIKSDEIVMDKLRDIKEEEEIVTFLDDFQINTEKHVLRYADGIKIEYRNYYPIECHPRMNIPEWIMELLICGVGIYDGTLDRKYTNHIFDLASKGQLSYLVANSGIVYGTNYPFSKVIIDKEFSKNHSLNTIFQLMGRSGRVGQSWSSKVYIDRITKDRIMDFIKGEKEEIELNNMNETFRKIIEVKIETNTVINKKIENEEEVIEMESNWFSEMKNEEIEHNIKMEKREEIRKNMIKQEIKIEVKSKYIPPHLRE